MRETIDVEFVRRQTGLMHVLDAGALAAFEDGQEIFDVDPHCRRLDTFVDRHGLDAVIREAAMLPCANPQVEKRTVWFGSARWRRRHFRPFKAG
jgi:hypothetical protein